ncbi:MAG: hypothetical protein WD848_01735 [Dehalococcoidia bacterium]
MGFFKFSGTGSWNSPYVGDVSGPASAVQTEDGKITLSIDFQSVETAAHLAMNVINLPMREDSQLLIRNKKGHSLQTSSFQLLTMNVPFADERKNNCTMTGWAPSVDVSYFGKPTAAKTAVYMLTNLAFFGDTPRDRRIGKDRYESIATLFFEVAGYNFELIPVQKHHEACVDAVRTRSTRHTADLRVSVSEGSIETQIKVLDDLVGEICTLLSLGMGNRVSWIARNILGDRDRLIHTARRHGVTSPFVPLPVIGGYAGYSIAPSDLRALIYAGLPRLRHWNARLATSVGEHPLTDATRLATDARQETVFLQARTLAAITSLEILASRLASIDKQEYIIARPKFKQVRQHLRTTFESLPEGALGSSQISDMMLKIPELNRRSALSTLGNLVRAAGLNPDVEGIRTYLRIRNSLVHTGDYKPNIAIRVQEQHWFIIHFVDRVLLGLLNYKGNYLPANTRSNQAPFPA